MKAKTRLISALLVALMVITILPTSAFAVEKDTEPTWTEYVIDTTGSGKETPMPTPKVVEPPYFGEDFDDPEVEEEKVDPDAIKLDDVVFDTNYAVQLKLKTADKDTYTLDGELPEGIYFNEKNATVSGKALPASAGRTYVFTVSTSVESKTYSMFVPYKELSEVAVSGIIVPRVKAEPSYIANVTFLAGKTKVLGEQETLNLKWDELTPKDGYQPFPFFKYGYTYRCVVSVLLPAGYRIKPGALVSLNGYEARYFINNTGSKMEIVYYFASCGMQKTNYAITYDFSTEQPSANNKNPRSVEWKYKVEPYNYAPVPVNPDVLGYIFGGWYEDSARQKPYNFDTVVNHNRVIYAKWIEILNKVEISTSNIYNSVNSVRPTISTKDNAKYRVVGSDWITAADNMSASKDVIYYGDLEAGNTYTLRVAIQPLPTWGVFPESGTSVKAEANGVPVQNRYSDDRSTLYIYFPVNILNGTHTHRLQHFKEVPATCEKSGTREYWKCKDCGQIFLTEEATVNYPDFALYEPPLNHNWGDWTATREATCKAEGKEVRVCLNDEHHKQTRVVPKVEHKWGEWETIYEATETKNGKMQRRCEECHAVESQYIPATNHTHTMQFVPGTPPTCDLTGLMDYYLCTGCRRKFADEAGEEEITGTLIIPATGHNWSEWFMTLESTKETEGEEARVCQNDPTHVETRPLPKVDPDAHAYYNVAKTINEDWQSSDKTTVILTAEIPYKMFAGVAIDGEEIDDSNYVAVEGRGETTQVTLLISYLNQLDEGTHQVDVLATDGEATTAINIVKDED